MVLQVRWLLSVRCGFVLQIARGPRLSFLTASDRFAGFFVCGAAALGLPFIPKLLALCQSKFQFHSAILEVHSGGNQRESSLLRLSDKLAKFFFVDKQLPGPQWCVVKNISVLIGADVTIQAAKARRL